MALTVDVPAVERRESGSQFFAGTGVAVGSAVLLGLVVLAAVRGLGTVEGREDGETLIFLLVFGGVVPASIVAAELFERLARARGSASSVDLAAVRLALVALMVAAAAVRVRDWAGLVPGRNSTTLLAAGAIVLAGAALTARLALRRSSAARTLDRLAVVAGVLAAGVLLLAFSTESLLDASSLAPAAVVAAVVCVLLTVRARALPAAARRWVDVLACMLLLALATDISNPPVEAGGIHQAFYAGPVNSILLGRPVLTETFSQYGAGMFDFLAGVFEIVPLGYGTFGLLVGLLAGLQLVVVYAVMRAAGLGQLVTALTSAVIVAVNLYGPSATFVAFPSTGALRFGLGWLLVAAAVFAWRRPGDRLLNALPWATLGVASVWSFEAFVYCVVTMAALVAMGARLREVTWDGFAHRLARDVAAMAVVVVGAHLAFALLTRLFAGDWPDWGGYLEYIRLYSVNGFGTMLVDPWQAGVAMAGMYVVSLVVACRYLIHRRDQCREAAPLMALIVGVTAFGVASFTYYLGRSHPMNQLHIAPVAIVLGAAWWAWAARWAPAAVPLRSRIVRAAAPSAVVGLLLVAAWPTFGDDFERTVVAQGLSGGPGRVADRLDWLWSIPAVHADTARAERLETAHLDGAASIRLLPSNVDVELAIRTGRLNLMPWSDPLQDDLTLERTMGRVRTAVDALPDRTWMTIAGPDDSWVELQRQTLALLEERYAMHEVADSGGIRVVRLTAR